MTKNNVTVTLSFTVSPYYAGLLTSFYELMQFSRLDANFDECSGTSIEQFDSIMCEVAIIAASVINDDPSHCDMIAAQAKRIIALMSKKETT